MAEKFSIEQMDHVHVFVLEQHDAARWYEAGLDLSAE